MNLYEIVNTETGETITGAMGYTEAQRYMQSNQLSTKTHELKIYMPAKRKTTTETTESPITLKEILKDAYEVASRTDYVVAEFATNEIALERAEQLKTIGAKNVTIRPNTKWVGYTL